MEERLNKIDDLLSVNNQYDKAYTHYSNEYLEQEEVKVKL